ncbi:MAG: hypothetical protein AABX54_03335 [Nanoarchaeota archaeon]
MGITDGFTVESWKHIFLPAEDACKYSQSEQSKDFGIISVADGITRDCTNGELPDTRTLVGQFKFVYGYPRPSPAFYVADLFCRAFNVNLGLMHLMHSEKERDKLDENDVSEGFKLANQQIRIFNQIKFPNPNYLKNDLAGCVASGAVINGRDVFYGYIADCGFIVFDNNGNIRFKTPNEGPNSKGSIDEDVTKRFFSSFKFTLGRRMIRSVYRNNPKEPLSYGALTGEIEALDYVRTGYFELRFDDIAMVFTDGLEKVIQSGEFADGIRARDFARLKKLCKRNVRTEGSLCYAG